MSVTEKLEKALNDFMGEINERLDSQKTMVFDVEQLVEQAFGAGAKAAATTIKEGAASAQIALRDQFAMAALPECACEHRYKNDNGETVAKEAYMFADAMLKERKK